jgi:hypothetical protein
LLSPGLLSADSQIPESYSLPSKQQVITFLTDTIEWYRYFSVERQIAAEPFDFLFLDDNEPVGTQVVQLSFDFARTDASLAATSQTSLQGAAIPNVVTSDFQHIVQMEVKTDAESEQASKELESIKTKLLRTRGADRRKLEATLADAQSRLGVLQEHDKSLRNLAEIIQVNGASKPQTADLGSLVEDLARTVPEVSSSSLPGPPRIISDPKPQGSGILGLASEVSGLQAKLRTLDEGMQLTDKLAHSSESFRTPLTNFVNQAVQNDDLGDGLQSNNLGLLQQQTARLDALTSRITSLAPAVSALDKQRVLLAIYRSRLTNWRKAVINEYTRAWKNLILHLVLLGLVIVALTGVSVVLRRATIHYVHDANRRRIILVVQRNSDLAVDCSSCRIRFCFRSEIPSDISRASHSGHGGCTPKRDSCRSWVLLAGGEAGNQCWRQGADFRCDGRRDQYRPTAVPTQRGRWATETHGSNRDLFKFLRFCVTRHRSVQVYSGSCNH